MGVEGAQEKTKMTAITGHSYYGIIHGGTITIVLKASTEVTLNIFFLNFILYVDIYLILGCKTVNGKKCIFPFLYQWGEEYYFEYNRCTTYGNSGKFWCATKVDGQGYWLEEDDCAGCPGEEHLLHIILVSECSYSYLMHLYK